MKPLRVQALGIPGTGPSLVLLPGMVGDGDVFARQAPLGRLGAVYAVDLPDDPALDRLDDIAGRLEPALPSGPLVLLGVSLGALVARVLARQMDGRVCGVVGFGGIPHPRHIPAGLHRIRPLLGWIPERFAARGWRRRLDGAMAAEGINAAERAILLRRLPSPAVARARLDAVLHLSEAPGPPPAAWLRGQLEREAPWTVAGAARDLPTASIATIPGGHRAHWTHSTTFNPVAASWWRALASSTG